MEFPVISSGFRRFCRRFPDREPDEGEAVRNFPFARFAACKTVARLYTIRMDGRLPIRPDTGRGAAVIMKSDEIRRTPEIFYPRRRYFTEGGPFSSAGVSTIRRRSANRCSTAAISGRSPAISPGTANICSTTAVIRSGTVRWS